VLAQAKTGERDYIHLFGDSLYWTESGPTPRIARLPRGQTTPQYWDVSPLETCDFAVINDDTIVFGAALPTSKIVRGKLGTTSITGVTDVAKTGLTDTMVLDPTGDTIWMVSDDGLRSCQASNCVALTANVTHVPDAATKIGFSGLAVDATTVWFGSNDGRVSGLAK
jgi:hypothetical protein